MSPLESRLVLSQSSKLQAPVMRLEGHESEVLTTEFHPSGSLLLSGGFDRKIFIWNAFGECENILVMAGHTGCIMEGHFSPDGNSVYSCSTDKSIGIWDLLTGQRIRRLKGHTSFINSLQRPHRNDYILCSGSDDCTIRIWDSRRKLATQSLEVPYQVTAVSFSHHGNEVLSAGIDNEIKVWDLRKNQILYALRGHLDTITGISISPDGSYLLSNCMDNTLRIWDLRPYVIGERCVKVLSGHQHSFEKNLLRCAWSSDGSKVSGGSADRFVYIWDTTTRRILHKLPGHNSSVNDVDFNSKQSLILSASSDKTLYIGEIEN